jgi:DNA-binding transcriptional regulator GbsR (MarR family)
VSEEARVSEAPTSTSDHIRDPAAVSRFVERFAQLFVEAGMPRIASRIFIALVATDSGRLTAGELAERLRASPAAISGGVRYLAQVNLISREREPGSRRDHYRVDNDVWYQTITQRDQLLAQWTASLREGAEVLGEDTPAGSRLAESVEFFEFMQKELALMLQRWHEHRAEVDGSG